MTTYSIDVSWPELHAALRVLDNARAGSWIGRDSTTDAFGGTYYAPSFESLHGLLRICRAVARIRTDTWERIHGGSGKVQVADARQACRVALALDDVDRILARTGLVERAGRNVICGISNGIIALTGLCWLCGMSRDDRDVPVSAVRDFAGGGPVSALRAALESAERTKEVWL